jgi:hypothetical protein
MNKYEQLIEYIINEDEDKAKALFHDIVVEKSRDIYESLIDEETVDEEIGGNEVEDLVDEIQADETNGISEEGDEEIDADEEMMAGDEEEDHHADVGGNEELEDKVMDLEKELEELKAEFDALMADEMEEPEHAEMKDDAEELEMYEGDEEVAEEKEEEVSEDAEEVAEEEEVAEDAEEVVEDAEEVAEEVAESKTAPKYNKTAIDLMREYVEKVSSPSNTEGADNKDSVVANKNDMGGTAVDPTGEEKGAGTPKSGSMPHAGNYQNVPGAKADLSKAPSAKSGEEGGVNKDSVEKGGN